MPRIISIDYGLKRTGLAVTDPLQIIATGLTTVESRNLIPFLRDYFAREQVEMIIIGEPRNWDDSHTHATPLVEKCIRELYAVEQAEGSYKLNAIELDEREKIAVVFGNEVTGVEQSTIAFCDGCIEIPQLGMKHSLNVATAAGVVLWELVRKRIKTT